jgi:hypothetical protein
MKVLIAILFFSIAPAALAAGFCERKPLEPDFPAGLEGRYEIIGKDPATGAAYSGYLAVAAGKTSYGIGRVVNGKASKGHAWIESCGADKIAFLVAEYATEPAMKARCRLGADGDNYYRATCRTDSGASSWRGLESWFQSPDLAP